MAVRAMHLGEQRCARLVHRSDVMLSSWRRRDSVRAISARLDRGSRGTLFLLLPSLRLVDVVIFIYHASSFSPDSLPVQIKQGTEQCVRDAPLEARSARSEEKSACGLSRLA